MTREYYELVLRENIDLRRDNRHLQRRIDRLMEELVKRSTQLEALRSSLADPRSSVTSVSIGSDGRFER